MGSESPTMTSAYLLPSFKYVPLLQGSNVHDSNDVQRLIKGFLQPEKLHPAHDSLSDVDKTRLTRDSEVAARFSGRMLDVNNILVLICGHGGRDARCGRYGPVLRDEFEKGLGSNGFTVVKDHVGVRLGGEEVSFHRLDPVANDPSTARVGLISHIGGHKFAGNAIVYLPPNLKVDGDKPHPLAGCGIWYGRVEPKHVEGIIKETVVKGRVIEDMFRGGIRQDKTIMRI